VLMMRFVLVCVAIAFLVSGCTEAVSGRSPGPNRQGVPTTRAPLPANSSGKVARPCEPDVAGTWQTKMVPWLTSVLVSVGGPDGQPLTAPDINDTGSALRIGSDRAEVVVYVYAGTPDMEHDPRPFMQRSGSIGDYAVYSSVHPAAMQYSAFGPETWLSLSAYATTRDAAAGWADDTDVHAWLQDMIARFAVKPIPSC
jgi:hypothetical protein